jgi:hypothetical protein
MECNRPLPDPLYQACSLLFADYAISLAVNGQMLEPPP